MEPTNKNERRKAFWNFFLLFLVCIILVGATVFSSTRVPFRQNEQLRKEIAEVETERNFSGTFFTQMTELGNMLDSITSKEKTVADQMDVDITQNIKNLDASVNNYNGYNKAFYKNVVLILRDLHESKKQLRNLGREDLDKGALQTKNLELLEKVAKQTTDIIDLTRQIDTLKRREMR